MSKLSVPTNKKEMPNPTRQQLENDPLFEAIWQVIKTWDVNVPEYYSGYCGANGSHVVLILNAIKQKKRDNTIEDLQDIVFQALGEASMCWSETPKGVFDSERATQIGESVMQAIENHEALIEYVDEQTGTRLTIIHDHPTHPVFYIVFPVDHFLSFDQCNEAMKRLWQQAGLPEASMPVQVKEP